MKILIGTSMIGTIVSEDARFYVGGLYGDYYNISAIIYKMEVYYAVMDPLDFASDTHKEFP
jgi:hypothetical protein